MLDNILEKYYDHTDDSTVHTFKDCYISYTILESRQPIYLVIDNNRKIIDLSNISLNPRTPHNLSDEEVLYKYNKMIEDIEQQNYIEISEDVFYCLTLLPLFISHTYPDIINLLRKYHHNNLNCKLLLYNYSTEQNTPYVEFINFILRFYLKQDAIQLDETKLYKIKKLYITQSSHVPYIIKDNIIYFRDTINKLINIDNTLSKRISTIKFNTNQSTTHRSGHFSSSGKYLRAFNMNSMLKNILTEFNFTIVPDSNEIEKIKQFISSDVLITSWGGSMTIAKLILGYRHHKMIVLCHKYYKSEWQYLYHSIAEKHKDYIMTKYKDVVDTTISDIKVRYILDLNDEYKKDIFEIINDFLSI